jgi:gamma-glutamyltranspeptidase
MTLDDLASYTGEWTTPVTTGYHGYQTSMLPPPAQAWAAD